MFIWFFVVGSLLLLLLDVAAAFDARLIQYVSVKILHMAETGRLVLVVNGVAISSVGLVVLVV